MRQGSLPRQGDHLNKSITGKSYCPNDAAFEPKADIQRPRKHVRFTPNSDRESEFPQNGRVRFAPESGARCYISSPLMGALASSEGVLGLTGNVETSCADARRGSAGGITCAEDVGLDVVFWGGFAYGLGSDRLTPQESAIEGPAV
jgi:hypothetical protein